ncbi:MAG: aminotransferase class I/II-fold pyridoxal phosphate-dependent enzyme [Terriglobia bacterium]
MHEFSTGDLDEDVVHRRLRAQQHRSAILATVDGHPVTLFSTNDYLGLSQADRMKEAAASATRRFGTGAGASRLVSGNHELYEELEAELARFKGKEAALVFPTGYMANLGLIATVISRSDTVHLDRQSHASLYDGLLLSRAKVVRYRSERLEELAVQLESTGADFVVTDGVFSMGGGVAPLEALSEMADRAGATLVVDDAHGTGVLGRAGRGTSDLRGAPLDFEIGTLSKAFGSLGGYVVGPASLIDQLINKARQFIFTTGLPPGVLAASAEGIRLARGRDETRDRLRQVAGRLRTDLRAAGYAVPDGPTPIIPVIIGAERSAMRLSEACLERGYYVPAIRKPAVPAGEARLRLSLSALHTDGQVEGVLKALVEAGTELDLI